MRLTFSFLALVCSIFGTTSEPTHDRNNSDGSKPYGINTLAKHRPEMRQYNINTRGKRETNDDPRCDSFTYKSGMKRLTHPRDPEDLSKPGDGTYTKNTTCFTTIEAGAGQVITLTFVDVFHIEGHPQCINDYLEIRDGGYGYSTPVYKFCGNKFPPTITSTGPFLWLKFKSDDIIEYSGFIVDIDFPTKATSKKVPESCYISATKQISGVIDSDSEDVRQCRLQSTGWLDIQWKIETAHGTQIYLNITKFQLAAPNNCSANSVQVFGAEPNFDHDLGFYCSSVAESRITAPEKKDSGPGNIMYVRMFTERRTSNFSATFTEFRTDESCKASEFDCMDGTCIDISLRCDGNTANCMLKSDEDPAECKGEAQSLMTDNMTILIIFSLIMSAIIFVLLFKCARKVYQDQKQINAHRANLCSLLSIDKTTSQLTLNSKPARDVPHSLDYDNRANEMYRQNIRQKSSSSDSNFLQQPHSNEDWPECLSVLPEDVRIEHKSRPARDFSLREELLRAKGKEESVNRDASVGVSNLQEAECQTRESLFLMDPIIPKPGTKSGSNSRVVSGEGSPAPAPVPAPAPAMEPPLELRSTDEDTSTPQAERPMSSETTRSAPDVIIVSPSLFVEARR